MPAPKGSIWNESESYKDPWTLREVRRITTQGLYNETPTYHTNIGFSADGEFLIFASAREGKSAVYACHVPTGDITQLIDPVDGTGGYGSLNKANGTDMGNGMGIQGHTMCIAPRSRWVVFIAGRTLRAVQIDTLAERVLIEDIGPEWTCGTVSIDPDEHSVLVPVMPAHPEMLTGQRITRPYMDHFADGRGMRMHLLHVPLAGGDVTTAYAEEGIGGAHSPHCPTDPDLLLIDRDFPPKLWAGSDGKTTRIWTLRLSTGALTELPSADHNTFQVHSAWTWNGEQVVYHGPSAEGGYFIGVIDKDGGNRREWVFPQGGHYGHVSAMAGRPAIILDGNISPDWLMWLYYDEEQPRLELIARHGTEWNAIPGQYSHPHALCDQQGRWISFNAAHRGRSDVFVVKV